MKLSFMLLHNKPLGKTCTTLPVTETVSHFDVFAIEQISMYLALLSIFWKQLYMYGQYLLFHVAALYITHNGTTVLYAQLLQAVQLQVVLVLIEERLITCFIQKTKSILAICCGYNEKNIMLIFLQQRCCCNSYLGRTTACVHSFTYQLCTQYT